MSELPSFEFGAPDVVTVGAEGEPGHRLFFLQVSEGELTATLKMEKVQVAALAAWIAKTLEDLPAPGHLPDDPEPRVFLEPAWAIGSLGGNYDIDSDRIVLVAGALPLADLESLESEESLMESEASFEDDDEVPEATARVLATREQMAAVAIRATRLIEAGRPPCPLCGFPLDPNDHQCPKTNGYRPPSL
jgi:uncharacterized repeat protein (TIGR03847 family)